MTRRLSEWDYCQRSIYMITVTLEERRNEWLGHLVCLAENGEAQNSSGSVPPHFCGGYWRIKPTPFGEAVLDALQEMPRLYPQVKLIEKQLMPEHFHFIVFVQAPLPKPLGALIRGFKAGATKRWRMIAGGGIPKWAEGFQDTILFHEGQLEKMIAYIRANPARLAEKRANPALFSRVAMLALPLDGGRLSGKFEALGNRHLLSRPLHQVQCSRRYFAWSRISKPGGGLKIARDAEGEPIVASSTSDYRERLEAAMPPPSMAQSS